MKCEEFDEISGAYALRALPADEMRDATDHLLSCDNHPEVAELSFVATGLALSAPEMDPPPVLKSRLMAAVRADLAAETARPGDAIKRVSEEPNAGGLFATIRAWLAGPRLGYGISAALAVVVAALAVWNVSLQADDGPDTGGSFVTQLSGAASGTVTFVEDEGLAIMEIEGLDAPPAGSDYQAWAISGGQPTSLGVIEADPSGHTLIAMTGVSPEGVQTIAITIEPVGGSELPTTEPIITGNL